VDELYTTPTNTSSSEFSNTGRTANMGSEIPASVTSKADAPPGGCRQRNVNMRPIASATAKAAVHSDDPNISTHATPASADSVLPAKTAHGCASGLAGTPNTSTADAPMGATSQGHASPAKRWLLQPANKTPNPAPATTRRRSRQSGPMADGRKACSQIDRPAASGERNLERRTPEL